MLEVADRADVRGGEIRDLLQHKLRNSKRLSAFRSGVSEMAAPAPREESRVKIPSVVQETSSISSSFSYGDPRKAAQIFGARSCPWSGRSLRLLDSAGVKATYLDLDHPGSGSMREELRVETGQLTMPYIYLRGRFIGGFNALDEIHRLGQLEYLVLTELDRPGHPDHGKVEIAQRTRSVDAFERPPE